MTIQFARQGNRRRGGGLRFICITAAPGAVRPAKALEAAGFRRMGEVESVRPDGTARRSLYWELTRAQWERMHMM